MEQEESPSSIYYNMLGSMTSGLIGRVPCHPLDTLKAKLQVQQSMLKDSSTAALKSISHNDPHIQSRWVPTIRNLDFGIGRFLAGDPTIAPSTTPFKNARDAFQQTLRREGVIGLYRGLLISAIPGMPASCLYFTTYESTRRYLNQRSFFNDKPFASDFCGGFIAEIVSCILFVPIDVIKERMQVQSLIEPQYRYRSFVDAVRKMAKNEGFRGLYKAYGATIVSFGPFSALYLMLYEQFKHLCGSYVYGEHYQLDEIASRYIALSACTAGAIAAVVTNPLDMVKLRMQVQRGGFYNFGYKHIFHGLKMVLQQESASSLFHGSAARVAFWVPNLAVNLTLYETCTRFYKQRLGLNF